MAEPEPHGNSGEDKFGFLVRKIGPLPVWGWAAIIVGLYYWYTHYGPGATSSTATTPASTTGTGENVTETLNTSTGPVTVNKSTGTSTPAANSPLNEIIKGGHVISNNPKKAVIGWTIAQQSPNAKKLQIVLNGPGHKNQTRYIPANASTATFEDLSPHHTYVADVTPLDSAGQAIGGPNHVTFITGG